LQDDNSPKGSVYWRQTVEQARLPRLAEADQREETTMKEQKKKRELCMYCQTLLFLAAFRFG
jgi:hypothetical protein